MFLSRAQATISAVALTLCVPALIGAERSSMGIKPPLYSTAATFAGTAEGVEPTPRPPSIGNVLDDLAAETRAAPDRSTAAPGPEAQALGREQLITLAARCAPATPASVIVAIVGVESAGRPLLLGQNGPARKVFAPVSRVDAEQELDDLQASGANFDVGLMQVNSSNLRQMQISARDALDPCRNVAIGAAIFDQAYGASLARRAPTAPLLSAYSAYNTGSPERGFFNGYVDKVDARLRSAKLSFHEFAR